MALVLFVDSSWLHATRGGVLRELASSLRQRDYAISGVLDAYAALDVLELRRPDLVVLEYQRGPQSPNSLLVSGVLRPTGIRHAWMGLVPAEFCAELQGLFCWDKRDVSDFVSALQKVLVSNEPALRQ